MAFKLNNGFLLAALVAVVAAVQLVGNADAATYVVGDSLGWTIPPNGPVAYSAWASQHVFRAGDVLVFNFSTGIHDVAYVNRSAFDGCTSSNPISLATVGPASLTLNSSGEHYYICTFGQHCSFGQKLAVNVTAASTTPAPAPAPSSPPPPAQTPTPGRAPAPAPSAPTTPTPTPMPTPTPVPAPAPVPSRSPSPAESPSSMPSSPTPSGSVTPPPSPASESTPTGELTPPPPPPPPPSSATIATISAPFVVLVSIAVAIMI